MLHCPTHVGISRHTRGNGAIELVNFVRVEQQFEFGRQSAGESLVDIE
jgi:hypothetical protein